MERRKFIREVILFASSVILLAEVPSVSTVLAQECNRMLLEKPWELHADKDAAEAYQDIRKNALVGVTGLKVTLDLHGAHVGEDDDAASIIIDDNGDWYVANIIREGKAINQKDGVQVIEIQISSFIGLGKNKNIPPNFQDGEDGTIHVRIWSESQYAVEITKIETLCETIDEIQTPTPTPTEAPPTATLQYEVTDTPQGQKLFSIRSVDTMKLTKDRVCNQPSNKEIASIIDTAKEMGANFVTVDTPYDDPSCASAVEYTARWVKAIRKEGLFVWHRHMPIHFEGFESKDELKVNRVFGKDIPKELQKDAKKITSVPYERLDQYLVQIYAYIIKNKSFFEPGDIFTPSPEPDSRGVDGITSPDPKNQFKSKEDFNQWMQDADAVAKEAFLKSKKDGIKVGYWGISGYTAAGLDNPDWEGKTFLDCATIEAGTDPEITVDHYPTGSHTMQDDLAILIQTMQKVCPDLPMKYILGEFGSDDEKKTADALQAAKSNGFDGFNYWPTYEFQDMDSTKPNSLFALLRQAFRK